MALTDLPLASGIKIAKAFERLGWAIRGKGNHFVLTNPNVARTVLSIPNHKCVKRPLLHAQIRRAGLTDEQFCAAFQK